MSCTRPVTNDTVFTDTRTDRTWVDALIRRLHKDGEIFSPSDMTTGVHVTSDLMWELTPASLMYYIDNGDWLDKANPIFLNGVPHSVREEEDLEESEYFETLTSNQIAEEIAEYSIEYGSVQDEMGNFCTGYERTALIVVHEETTQLGGFIPLVRALTAKQKEFPKLPPVRVYVHSGTYASLRSFEETPLTVQQTG